jgi:WD40 repeat protein
VPEGQDHFWTASLHPKHPSLALAAGGSSVQLWDLSSMSSTGGVSKAHKLPIRDVSWAPNNEHRFVTGGDDGKLRFWDTRCAGLRLGGA